MDLKPEDFEGIGAGDIVYFGTSSARFLNPWGVISEAARWQIDKIVQFQALTGKYAPWSSEWVPDWATHCRQDKISGHVIFMDEVEHRVVIITYQDDEVIITKRPPWCVKKGE